jgi:glutaredoxin-related protein
MKIIFYSQFCEFCKKLLIYLDKNNIADQFKLVDIDNNTVPNIKIVPTIIDTNLNTTMEGKKAFEYLINIKYFNNPTNNIENKIPINPKIDEDKLAMKLKIGLELE